MQPELRLSLKKQSVTFRKKPFNRKALEGRHKKAPRQAGLFYVFQNPTATLQPETMVPKGVSPVSQLDELSERLPSQVS